MKAKLFFILVIYSVCLQAQLKVEQLSNDSLVKVFIFQQTGIKTEEMIILSVKTLKNEKLIRINDSMLRSLGQTNYLSTDFNEDGLKDLVVCYSNKKPNQKYYHDFYIEAFISNSSNSYIIKKIGGEDNFIPGVPVKLLSEKKQFVLSRFMYDYDEEKIVFDTLKYFQGEFLNSNSKCEKKYSSLKFYTTSSWMSTPNRTIVLFPDGSLFKEETEISSNSKFKGKLKQSFLDSLNNLICEINLEILKENYELPFIRDAGTFHLRIQYADYLKKLDDYGWAGNFGLIALYKMLWRINKETVWTLVSTTKPDYKLKKMPGDN